MTVSATKYIVSVAIGMLNLFPIKMPMGINTSDNKKERINLGKN